MQFAEFQGVTINLDQIKICRKSFDKSKVTTVTDQVTGSVKETIEGRPFIIEIDFGDQTLISFTYPTRVERDSNYDLLLNVLEVQKK